MTSITLFVSLLTGMKWDRLFDGDYSFFFFQWQTKFQHQSYCLELKVSLFTGILFFIFFVKMRKQKSIKKKQITVFLNECCIGKRPCKQSTCLHDQSFSQHPSCRCFAFLLVFNILLLFRLFVLQQLNLFLITVYSN